MPLRHKELRNINLFSRTWFVNPDGGYSDRLDRRPFSTQFAFTRFLAPLLQARMEAEKRFVQEVDLVAFVDCDFLFKGDIRKLFEDIRKDPDFDKKAVWCVKHNFNPTEQSKMDNCDQFKYNRKLWSALMVFNMAKFRDPLDKKLYVQDVNSKTGQYLHQFQWLSDDEIGDIPESWQFIPNHSELRVPFEEIKAIHYTRGVPTMGISEGELYDQEYFDVLDKINKQELIWC